jgi:hypothetical protein
MDIKVVFEPVLGTGNTVDLTLKNIKNGLISNGVGYGIDPTQDNFLTNRADHQTNYPFIDNDNVAVDIQRSTVTSFVLDDITCGTTAADQYLKSMCTDMTNLTYASIIIPNNITTTAYDFCGYMFKNCTNLKELNQDFTFPQSIITAGQGLGFSMFMNCTSLKTVPNGFNLPQNLTTITGYAVFAHLFDGCTSLISLPQNFQIPQNISVGIMQYFCEFLFNDCTDLTYGTSPNQITLKFKGYSNGTRRYADAFAGTCTIDPNTPNPGAGLTIDVLVASNS